MDAVFRPSITRSPVPDRCKTEPCILGIDEAGRGPFLGPMVYACAYWPEADDARISRLGFDDSKALTNEKRRALFSSLQRCGEIGYVIISISSEDISARMLRRTPVSLNAISHDTAEQLVQTALDAGVTLARVYVDTVGDPAYYEAKLTKLFGNRIPFTVRPKADSLFKVVSAASICGKVTRDDALPQWHFREPFFAATCVPRNSSEGGSSALAAAQGAAATAGVDARVPEHGGDEEEEEDDDGMALGAAPALTAGGAGACAPTHPDCAGSGYPGDPLTKAWLAANFDPVFGWPSVARFSWATAKVAFKGTGAVRVTWEGDDEDGSEAGAAAAAAAADTRQQRLSAFFTKSSSSRGGPAAQPPAGRFFARRGIEAVFSHSDSL